MVVPIIITPSSQDNTVCPLSHTPVSHTWLYPSLSHLRHKTILSVHCLTHLYPTHGCTHHYHTFVTRQYCLSTVSHTCIPHTWLYPSLSHLHHKTILSVHCLTHLYPTHGCTHHYHTFVTRQYCLSTVSHTCIPHAWLYPSLSHLRHKTVLSVHCLTHLYPTRMVVPIIITPLSQDNTVCPLSHTPVSHTHGCTHHYHTFITRQYYLSTVSHTCIPHTWLYPSLSHLRHKTILSVHCLTHLYPTHMVVPIIITPSSQDNTVCPLSHTPVSRTHGCTHHYHTFITRQDKTVCPLSQTPVSHTHMVVPIIITPSSQDKTKLSVHCLKHLSHTHTWLYPSLSHLRHKTREYCLSTVSNTCLTHTHGCTHHYHTFNTRQENTVCPLLQVRQRTAVHKSQQLFKHIFDISYCLCFPLYNCTVQSCTRLQPIQLKTFYELNLLIYQNKFTTYNISSTKCIVGFYFILFNNFVCLGSIKHPYVSQSHLPEQTPLRLALSQ